MKQTKQKRAKGKKVNENDIRKRNLDKLQHMMYEQVDKRIHRLRLAQKQRDTTRQWHLIAAAAEQANIEFHELDGAQATKMRGRSKVLYKKKKTTKRSEAWSNNQERKIV